MILKATAPEAGNSVSGRRNLFDRILDLAAFLAGLILALSVVMICIDVGMRYFAKKPITGILESTEYGLVFFTLLAVAWLLRRDKHVRMDMVLKKLKPRTQAWMNGFTSAASTVVCGIITYYGVIVVVNCYLTRERFSSTLEPLAYPLMAVVPVCFFLLSVQYIRTTLGYFAEARRREGKTGAGNHAQ